ncbi:hypothetical protein [Catenulispora subtropica]|uniref:Lipoprotein n=1 Tax=Catenulispora subtropica TaxID=450798 RepID=A0ABP5BV84_9ACTN
MIQARSVRLAAVVVLGGAVALATTACGGPMQAGAAAVVEGQRTTDRQVQSQVEGFVSLLVDNHAAQESVFTTSARSVVAKSQVSHLVDEAVWQRAADDLGLTVGPDADAQKRAALVTAARQELPSRFPNFHGSDNEAVALYDALSQNSYIVAPSGVPAYVHYKALYDSVIAGQAAKLHVPSDLTVPSTGPQLRQALVETLTKAAKEIDVKVSPRYGSYDSGSGQVVAAATSWIRPTKEQLADAMAQMQQAQ